MDICAIHPKNYENKYTTIQWTKLHCPRFGLSTFWFVDVLVCRRFGLSMVCRCFGLSTFWSVDVLVCRRFGVSTFRLSDVLVVDVLVCRRFDQLPTKGSTLTHQSLVTNVVINLQTTYSNGFLDFFYNLAVHEFLNMIYILVYIDLILSTFFQHSNILTRASHHWCLALGNSCHMNTTDSIDVKSTSDEVMFWCHNKPWPEPLLTQIYLSIWRY